MSKSVPGIDRDKVYGVIPTLKNKEIFEALRLKIGNEKLLKEYKDDFLEFTKREWLDPRKPTVFYRTKEQAEKSIDYKNMLNKMDYEYIQSRKTTKDPYYKETKANLEKMTDKEFIGAFNKEVGNKGWTSSRAIYLSLIHDELDRRKYDYSAIGDKHGFHLVHKVKLVGNKITAK